MRQEGKIMNWILKRFIPKAETRLMEIGENATEVVAHNQKYTFLDKFGNGIQFCSYRDTKSILWFVVDRQPVDDSTFFISHALTMYLEGIANNVMKEHVKLQILEDKKKLAEAVEEFNKKISE